MTIQELFIRSNQALQAVVSQIKDGQWELKMPAVSSYSPTPQPLKEAVQYHIYDDAWVPDVLAGKTAADVGDRYEHLRTTDAVQDEYRAYNQRANDAVRTLADTDLAHMTHLSYGDFPARDYLQHITAFRAFRSYDIAKLIGVDTTMEADFVQALTDEYSPVVATYRQMGVFPPPLSAAGDASPQAKLLAMMGRE